MRILFLLTTVRSKVHAHHATGFLSAMLKQHGHETDYLELPQVNFSLIREKIEHFKPHVMAVSAVMQQMPFVTPCINYTKNSFPEVKIILGGTHPILQPDCINEIEGLDVLCVGEGERPLLDFVQAVSDEKEFTAVSNLRVRMADGFIYDTPKDYAVTEEELANLPIQDRDVFPVLRASEYGSKLPFSLRVLWGRGCPYACTYCAVPSLRKALKEPMKASGAKWVRYPPVEKCIEEVDYLTSRWDIDTFVIDDDVLTTRKDWILELAEKYPSYLKDKVNFEANLRVESIDRESMAALKDMGCELLKFGLENGNYDIRKKILKRPITDEKIVEVFSWARDLGIPAHTFNMVGVPDETRATVKQTIRLNQIIRPSKVQVTIFYPYSGVPLGAKVRSSGKAVKETTSYFEGASVELKDMSLAEVERKARWLKYNIYKAYDSEVARVEFRRAFRSEVRARLAPVALLIGENLQKILPEEWFSRVNKLARGRLTKRTELLQVETMGGDGKKPEAQYDIEDMDQSQTT
jgi:anaerobic magnesium-protoporphyrin IX monomethyl ester cyclase